MMNRLQSALTSLASNNSSNSAAEPREETGSSSSSEAGTPTPSSPVLKSISSSSGSVSGTTEGGRGQEGSAGQVGNSSDGFGTSHRTTSSSGSTQPLFGSESGSGLQSRSDDYAGSEVPSFEECLNDHPAWLRVRERDDSDDDDDDDEDETEEQASTNATAELFSRMSLATGGSRGAGTMSNYTSDSQVSGTARASTITRDFFSDTSSVVDDDDRTEYAGEVGGPRVTKVLVLQAILIEFGVSTWDLVPGSVAACSKLIREYIHINLKDYIALKRRGKGIGSLTRYNSRKELIASLRTDGPSRFAKLAEVKRDLLNPLLVSLGGGRPKC